MAKSSEDYTISDEEIEYWDSWHKARDERMAEFEKRENSVKSPFESFYYETETQLGQSY